MTRHFMVSLVLGLAFVIPQSAALAQRLPALFPTHRDLVYGAAGGEKQRMDIYYPDMLKPVTLRPVILLVHGGAWREGNKSDMALAAALFTKADFVAISIGYRLFHPEKRKQNIYPAAYDDVQRAVRFLRVNSATYGIDPQRIGAMGFSAGGHLVALLGTTDTRDNSDPLLAKVSSRINAVVSVSGPTDLTTDYANLRLGKVTVQELIDDFIGRNLSPKALLAQKKKASPLFHVDGKTVPHLFFHGDNDMVVPVENSRKMAAALKAQKISAEIVEFPGEGHAFKLEMIPQLAEKSSVFSSKHLKP